MQSCNRRDILLKNRLRAFSRNIFGAVLLAPVALFASSPQITTQPANVTVNQGQDVHLSVSASGTAPLTYQWSFNGQPILLALSSSLTLRAAQGNQSGGYSVSIANLQGSITSRVASVLVVVPPAVVQAPASKSVSQGGSVTFTVVASGTSPTYQWQFNGANMAGITNTSLTLTNLQASQSGNYRVKISNSAGNVTTPDAALTVVVPPQITTQPSSLTLNQGQNGTLTVKTSGTSPGYQWFFNGTALAGATAAHLALQAAQGSQSGSYWVVVSNLAGTITSSIVTVLVIVPPSFLQAPSDASIVQGDSITFSVVASGTAPTYQWQFNGGNIAGATNSTFSLTNAQGSQSGSYRVKVSNAAGNVTTPDASLTVFVASQITTQPSDLTLNQGQNGTLNVKVSGTLPSYQWWFKGSPLPSATGANLALQAAQGSQSGVYWVVVSNLAGVVTSSLANVLVVVPPSIVQAPVGQVVALGNNVSFNVGASGTAPKYQWQFNTANINGATNATLFFSNVSSSQAGNYRVKVSNAAGSVTTPDVALVIIVPPQITTQPLSQVLLAGSDATFSAAASGTAPFAWQWFANGAPIGGATNSQVTLPSVQSAQSGAYYVIASNFAGSCTSSVAQLTVNTPPQITSQPSSQNSVVGQNVVLSVGASGDAPMSCQWIFNGTLLAGATNAALILPTIQTSQAGSYSVVVWNSYGYVISSNASLTVNVPALVTTQPADHQAVAGSTVTFITDASGTSPIFFQWRFNGTPISGATSNMLVLTNVDINDSGAYSVLVSNIAGADTSVSAALNVTRNLRQSWVARYNGAANRPDFPVATAVDAQGNVYVTGYAQEQGSPSDFVTLKYDPAGNLLWRVLYDGIASADDHAQALALDGAGNVYVTGQSKGSGSGWDYATIKYDSNGNQLWVARYNGTANQDDMPVAMAADVSGNVIVTGQSKGTGGHFNFVTIKYDANGNQLWLGRYIGPGKAEDDAQALTVDSAGNVYVTGKSKGDGTDFDYATLKYSSTGAQLWVARYNGPANTVDSPAAIGVDTNGNVYVTGQSKGVGSDFDYTTIKYAGAGAELWVARYDGPDGTVDQATALAVDPSGDVFVTGGSKGAAGPFDYATLKYNTDGVLLWSARYNGSGNSDDTAQAILLDDNGDAYVTGGAKGAGTANDMTTVKYASQDGQQLWAASYNGPANSDDIGRSLAISPNGTLYVTGESKGPGTEFDYALIKYVQPEPPIITLQPLSQTVPLLSTVVLLVQATSSSPLTFQWHLNGVNIPGATNATLLLNNVLALQSGVYQVTVANDADAVESVPATIDITTLPLPFADNFSNRVVVTTLQGTGSGNNLNASRELGELKHAGKTGGKSVWLTWRAPASGVVTFNTSGSRFDTLLAVYTGTNLTTLTSIASDDDSGGFLTSKVVFNAHVGTEYQIAIDGLNGASGDIVLNWNLDITLNPIPIITSMSAGQTVGAGEQVSFAVSVDQVVSFQWYLDGLPLPAGQQSAINITNVQLANVGLYYVRLMAAGLEIYSKPISLQINRTDNSINRSAVATDKFADVINQAASGATILRAKAQVLRTAAPSRGYSGTQMFTSYGGSTEPGEPMNCGIPGGASVWFAYQAPINGTLYINTDGSDFDTTLGVYTGNGTDFASMISVACDNNSGANGKTSAVRFQAAAGTTYYISVDGMNGASGHIVLNYNLGDPPAFAAVPQSQYVDAGGAAIFSTTITGTQPAAYQWWLNGAKIGGATNASLIVTNVQNNRAGTYTVIISNLVNAISSAASLTINSPTLYVSGQTQSQTVSEGGTASFTVSATGSGTLTYQWLLNGSALVGATNDTFSCFNVQSSQAGSYSVLLTDVNGSRLVTMGDLTVSPQPAIVQLPFSQTFASGSLVSLSVNAIGSPLLHYQWQRNQLDIPGATDATLQIFGFQYTDEGNYRVIVTNRSGAVVSSEASIMIGSIPRLVSTQSNNDGRFQFQVVGLPNTIYTVEASTNLIVWESVATVSSTNGFISFVDPDAAQFRTRMYRAVSGP